MTLNEVYLKGKNILKNAKIDSFAFDAMKIFEFCFNFDRQDIILYRNTEAEPKKVLNFFELINQRANGRPLQYILGNWNFMDSTFTVGEGVLIPRDDTEVLVNEVLAQISTTKAPQILDLCAGAGTISISLAQKRDDAKIFAAELSDIALKYLKMNINLNEVKNVTQIKLDVLFATNKLNFEKFDVIVSNPPYIPTVDLNSLQKEVLYEPKMALDGGDDGLKFYRAIAKNWSRFLKKTGCICVEIGIGQANNVVDIFKCANFKNIRVKKDLNGIERVITAKNLESY